MIKVELGKTYRDTVSGYEGVAVCRGEWLHECIRISLQAPVGADGKLPELACFDEGQLEPCPAKALRHAKDKPVGGPALAPPSRQSNSPRGD